MAAYRAYKKKIGLFRLRQLSEEKDWRFSRKFLLRKVPVLPSRKPGHGPVTLKEEYGLKKHKDPRTGEVSVGYCFDEYFKMLEFTGRKKPKTIHGEKWSRNQIEKYLGKGIFLSDTKK
jgi:hypothetical protein